MRVKSKHILFGINILTIILFVIIAVLPNNVARIILGLPTVLFFPGYTLLCALFSRRESLSDPERIALSFGLSIAVVSLLGLILNYTPWGIRLYSILISLFIFIFSMSIIGLYKNRKLPQGEMVSFYFNLKLPSRSQMWSGQLKRDKIITVALAVMLIGAIATLGYVGSRPRTSDKFTEFYILNDAGEANDYPSTVVIGQGAKVEVGVKNLEKQSIAYKIEISLDGEDIQEIGPFDLSAQQKLAQEVTIDPIHVGDNQELNFLLYKGDNANVYASLHLWIDVTPY